MTSSASRGGAPSTALSPSLAALDLLRIESNGPVLHVRLARPAKRNAINDALVAQLHTAFVNLPDDVRAVVISGEGEHFCAGLDLSELSERSVAEGILHSRSWHAAFDQIQRGRVPVVAVLHGAVVGGGLELASACHVRVAEPSTFYGLPEGQRGLFVGGGGSARIPRLIGVARMTDMMLTGRVYDADEGQAIGLSQYRVDGRQGPRQGARARRPHRRQCAAVEFRGHARPAAHRRHGPGRRPVRRVADGGDRPGRRCRQERMRDFLEGKAAEGEEDVNSAAAIGARAHERRRALSRPAARRLARGDADPARRRLDPGRLQGGAPALRRAPDRPLPALGRGRTRSHPRRQAGERRRLAQGELRRGAARRARSIAQWLLAHPLSVERPIAILSDNDIEHLLLALGAMLAGVPYAPISPAYSLVSQDHGKLKHIVGLLTPGLVFASGPAYAKAIAAAVPADTPVVLAEGTLEGRATVAVRRAAGDGAHAPPSTRRMPRSAPTRSPSSCSPPARPSCPRPWSTPSACSARTSR